MQYLNKKEDIYYFIFPIFEKYKNLFHLFTTRKTGYNGKTLDLGINTETPIEDIYKNYLKLCNVFNINPQNLVLSDQVHEDNILIIDETYKSNNFLFDRKVKNADGLITNKKNIFLVTLYADCTPIYFFDPKIIL
nr:laccase domain-containing protein [Marinitoga lauensis]